MPFFTYNQNNSGGSFDYSDDGISHYVIIEADTAAEANARAERIGLYFDGEGDCSCCGDRWSEAWEDDGDDVPSVYGEPILEHKSLNNWMYPRPEAFVHYRDRITAVYFEESDRFKSLQ